MRVHVGLNDILLFDRNSGVNILLDDFKPTTLKNSKAPRQISIALTNSCNLSCSHCYAPKSSDSLSIDQVLSWIKELNLNNCLGVGFGGGEPTLHPNFVEICKKTYQNTHMAVTFTTHGHTLNEDLINQLKPYVHFIRVSVDGVGANYERIRGVSFSNLNDKLKLLQGKIKYGVNFVVNDTTIHDIEELVSLIEKLGAEELLFLPEVPVGRGKAVSENAIAFLYEWIKNYTGSLRLAISSDTRQEGLPICSFSRESSTLESYAHIDATGTLKLSSYDNIGVKIKGRSIIEGLDELKKFEVVKRDKNMDRLRV